jgi:hypothetical protein
MMHYPFNDATYNLFCWLGRTGLPALTVAVVAIGTTLGRQDEATMGAGILTALAVMLNSLTTESKKAYKAKEVK